MDQGGPEEIATAYFEMAAKALRTKRYDSIAHPDLIRIYGTIPPFAPETLEGPIRGMLEAAVESDTCLEVNTSGLIKQLFELHPAPTILGWASELGVKLTLGSDSHHPDHVAQKFPEVIPLLMQLGFTKVHHFKGRTRFEEAL
jgi:histidinol-phosphatase (PHP family)